MQKTSWLIACLLWEVARYWEKLMRDGNSEDLFSFFYPDEPDFKKLSAAIDHPATEKISGVIREAQALASGISADEYASLESNAASLKKSFPALVSILSRVGFREDGGVNLAWHEVKDLASGVSLEGKKMIDSASLLRHLKGFQAEMLFLKKAGCHTRPDTVLTLVEKHFSCLPVLGAPEGSDIPLSAVSRVAAAIVNCWLNQAEDLSAPPSRDQTLFTLIQGDLSGIQRYIYRISSAKGVAKGLKGRSFEISLLTDQAVRYLLQRFRLQRANVIYNSGGSFMLLAPAKTILDDKKTDALSMIAAIQTTFEQACYEHFDGEIFLGLGALALSGNDFRAEAFPAAREKATQKCNAAKRQKFQSLISGNYDKIFEPRGAGQEEKTCEICRRENSGESPLNKYTDEETGEERHVCRQCEELKDTGRDLSRAGCLAEVADEISPKAKRKSRRLEPLALSKPAVVYYLLPKKSLETFAGESVSYYSFEIPDFSDASPFAKAFSGSAEVGFRYYGGNDLPQKGNEPAEYDDLAEISQGLRRLGVLRMDVDDLGQVFRSGLAEYEGEKAVRRLLPPARMIGLSQLMDYFFARRVSSLRREERFRDHILVVYSGGDDLFVVGSWNRVVEFAAEVHDQFREFVKNPHLTLSGGVALVPKKFPIHKAADLAGQAEAAAKAFPGKNAFSFLDKPLKWEHFEVADSICRALCEAIQPAGGDDETSQAGLTKGILDRLRRIYYLYDKRRRTVKSWDKKGIPQIEDHLEALRYDKWRWMLVYSLKRLKTNTDQAQTLIDQLQQGLLRNKWPINEEGKPLNRELIEFIDVPTRWAEFLTREPSEEEK